MNKEIKELLAMSDEEIVQAFADMGCDVTIERRKVAKTPEELLLEIHTIFCEETHDNKCQREYESTD